MEVLLLTCKLHLAVQELYEKSLVRVDDHNLPVDLLEIKTFLTVAQVNTVIDSDQGCLLRSW